MTLTGTNAEGVTQIADDIENVVVGKIVKIRQHPNADKLVICDVDVGNEILQIVTGAPNVALNQYVPVAVDGALLPSDKRSEKGKLRGTLPRYVVLCRELELARMGYMDDGVDGILVLDREYHWNGYKRCSGSG